MWQNAVIMLLDIEIILLVSAFVIDCLAKHELSFP